MEAIDNKEIQGKGISYLHYNENDKYYFGSFLNLAQNNINQIIEEFRIRLHLNKTEKDVDVINNYFSRQNLSFTDWERGIKILKEYLPIIELLDLPKTDKQFDTENGDKEIAKRKYFLKNFQLLLKTIVDLRNYYTHYYHPKLQFDPSLFKFLDQALLSTCLEVRKHKMKNDKTKQTLKSGLISEMKVLLDLEKEYQKEKGIKTWNIIENIEGAVYNNAFSHLIFKNKAGATVLRDYHKSNFIPKKPNEINSIDLSLSGLVFILSMFLSKKEIEQFKSNLEGFKGKVLSEKYQIDRKNNSLKFMATHWVFSYHAFKGLKQRVKNTFDKETLLMQMIDELNKVPDEVYQTLSENEKEQFLEDMNQYVQDNEENQKGLEQSTIIHPVIRKRYEDKFNYFAIRFLDEFAQFPTLKFKVYVGNYLHDNRTKIIPGSTLTSERLIKEKISVFENLSVINKVKSDFFKKVENQESTQWELFPNPSYDFIGNNIPIYIDLKKNGDETKQCQIEVERLQKSFGDFKDRENGKPTKETILKELYSKTNQSRTTIAILSINEMPSLLYELLINKKSGAEIENEIAQKIAKHFNELRNYSTDQNLSKSSIPKKMRISSSIDTLNIDKLYNDIEKEIKICNEKLTLIDDNKRDYNKATKDKRKHIFFSNEIGKEATWIANDIKRFMPKEAKTKWKGNYHSELQKYIAFYETNKKDAITLLNENWNFDTDVFFGEEIQKAFLKSDFVSFYQEYLNQRRKILNGMSEHIKMWKDERKNLNKGLKDIYRIFDKRLYQIKTLSEQKEQLLIKPIHLPRGLFDEKPTFVLGKKVTENPELFADWYQYCYDVRHTFQSFYELKGDYKELFEKFKREDEDALLNKKKLNQIEMFDLFKRKYNLKIKEVKHRDLFIKLMVDTLFKSLFNQEIDFDLKAMYQDAQERYKNQVIANKQKSREQGDASENILNENFIWNRTVAISLFDGQLFEPKVKLKDIGKFRKLESDSKVHNILAYDNAKVWTKLQIEDELENKANSYERVRREKLLCEIQKFELYLLEKEDFFVKGHPTIFENKKDDKSFPNFKKYIANGVLRKDETLSELEVDFVENINYTNDDAIDYEKVDKLKSKAKQAFFLILLRNKFAHNQLPSSRAFQLINKEFNKEERSTYAEYYLNFCHYLINDLKK